MFVYYQKAPEAKWEYLIETGNTMESLIEEGIPMVSILSIREPVDDSSEESKYQNSYKGDFYIDIDNSDISLSIASAQIFCSKLDHYGVEGYDIFISGKKGFHILVPFNCFSSGRPVKHLPLIYREMAFELYTEGVDMAVYNEGRPRMWRTPNVKRDDNGKYKVQITKDELDSMTAKSYAHLASSPRPLFPKRKVSQSIKFKTLFEVCKNKVVKILKHRSEIEITPQKELVASLGKNKELPGCVLRLIKEGDTKPRANFNKATMQFATFFSGAGIRDWDKYAKQMAHNVKSSSYNTEGKRLAEIRKMVRYVSGTDQYQFSKAAFYSVVEPCGECPLCQGAESEFYGEDGTVIDSSDVKETPKGYYIGKGKAKHKVTTFTLDIINKFTQQAEGGENGVRVGTHAIIKVGGASRDKVVIPEEAWLSAREFKKTFIGREGYAFYGNDLDLQKLQNFLFSDTKTMDEITYVHSVGMHRHKVGTRTLLVYAEPGFSVSSTRERDTHHVWGEVPATPNIKDAVYPEPSKALRTFIDKMMACNDEFVVANLIGWMSLCHIKVQLTMRENQFPVLNVWGNVGSGKTSLSALFACLHGVDYLLEHAPISLEGTTPWATAQYCTSSESVPRLIEEFNEGQIPKYRYDQFAGMLKAAWNMQTFAKGGVDHAVTPNAGRLSGPKVIASKISSPIIVMSEQAPKMPALRQRMIQLNVSRRDRERPEAEDAYYYLVENREMFYSLARAMVWQSLVTHPETVKEMFDSHSGEVPRSIDARPRYSYQALLTGLDFFGQTLKAIGLSNSFVDSRISSMSQAVIRGLTQSEKVMSREKLTTEAVLVLAEMALQAESGRSINANQWALLSGKDYVKTDEFLYIDSKVAHSKYCRWARAGGVRVVLTQSDQFEFLVKQENFYAGSELHPDIANGRRLAMKLRLGLLSERGIDINMFEGDDEL